jgi:hypothetical protein
MTNVQRLLEELQFVTRNRAHHKQSIWFEQRGENACGSTGCLAGWTAMHHAKDQLVPVVIPGYGSVPNYISYEVSGGDWTSLGADLLDLEFSVADELFNADNTIWDLWHIANVITRGQIEIPEEVQAEKRDYYNRTDDDPGYVDFLIEISE